MRRISTRLLLGAIVIFTSASTTSAQEEPFCVENSPERKGEMGCSIVEIKPLPENLREPAFWHIDSFEKEGDAGVAVRPASIAFQAHGSWWLMTIESQPSGHHGGACISPEAPAAAASAEIFDACYLSVYTIRNDLAG